MLVMEVKLTDIELRDIPAIGTCDVCGKTDMKLMRTYFRFEEVKCECHSPYHFELVDHCKTCEPKKPIETKILHKVIE
jgi:hypothetical protein